MVNGDPALEGRLRVAFLPNYSVSLAEVVFPACDLSQQISTAGTEASGTGNMKAALNGALTIGTLDGANVEIRDEVGPGNIYIFGHTAEEVAALRAGGYAPRAFIDRSEALRRAVATLTSPALERSSPGLFRALAEELTSTDRYLLCADFDAYVECQRGVEEVYARPDEWWRRSILNVAGMGKFSADRTTREYAREIWGVESIPISPP